MRVRHTHMPSIAVDVCLYRSLPSVFHRLPEKKTYVRTQPHYLYLFLHLLHVARPTAQTTTAAVHRAFLPRSSYNTTILLLSSSSSGHTLRVWMIVLGLFIVDLSGTSIDHLIPPPPHRHHLSPCCFFCVWDAFYDRGSTYPLQRFLNDGAP